MSAARRQLIALQGIGAAENLITGATGIPIKRLWEVSNHDFPLPRKYRERLEVYTRSELRRAYTNAPHSKRSEIAAAFASALGTQIASDSFDDVDPKLCAYVAWLLGVNPYEVFPFGPECSEDATDHLWSRINQHLAQLLSAARVSTDRSPTAVRYLTMLLHAEAVFEGREDPSENGWFENLRGYRRGVYLLRPASAAWSAPNDR